jgi:biopolymer transport protein ExbD
MKTSPLLPLHPVLAIAAFNLILLIFLFLIFCSSLTKPAGFEIRIPRALVSEGLQEGQSIVISAENVLYFNKKAVTFSELKKDLSKVNFQNQNIFIRIDRRSSMGRVIDILELCRSLGSSHVHILTGQED